MINKQRTRNAGFSLTEVLMAAGILAVGFMMLLTLFPLGLQLTAKQTEATIGTLAAREAFSNASMIMQSNLTQKLPVPNSGYEDFRSIFWTDNADGVIDDREGDYVAGNGDYELSYDPYLFLYPTASDVSDENKKYNSAVLIGDLNGDYAEAIVFACRRVGTEANFPLLVADDILTNAEHVGNRPSLLSLQIDNDFVDDAERGDLLKIHSTHDLVLDTVGIDKFISLDSYIAADSTGNIYRVVGIQSGTGEYYIRINAGLTGAQREAFGRIWFVPPAIGANRSAAVDASRQTIKVK